MRSTLLYAAGLLLLGALALADSSGLVTCSTPTTTCAAVTQICGNASVVCSNPTYTCRQVCAPTPAPTPPAAPAAGYSAWFDAGAEVYQDAGGTIPALSDGDVVSSWKSKDGSFGALACISVGGYGVPHLKLGANGINGQPVVRSVAASFELLMSLAAFDGVGVSGGTALAVASRSSTPAAAAVWGLNNNASVMAWDSTGGTYGLRNYLHDGAYKDAPVVAAPNAGGPYVFTWHHEAGQLHSGVNDTRTASMPSVAAGDVSAASTLVLLGYAGPGGYMDGDLAEVIFYPTALSEADRQTTEQYLATKYGITLPY